MTAKEKAKQLVSKFNRTAYGRWAVDCAIICVDEIMAEIQDISFNHSLTELKDVTNYWEEVKKELSKL